jgi:hypothetical protein
MSLINLNLFRLVYAAPASFAQTIHDGFVTKVADYPTPPVLMVDFQSDIDNLLAAIAKWGVKGNRGSHADHIALIVAATIVRNDLRILAQYAQSEQPDNSQSWIDVGFQIKSPKSAPKPLGMVQNFRRLIQSILPEGKIKLKWKKPLNTKSGDVKGYIIQFNNTNIKPDINGSHAIANIAGIIPDTAILIEPPYVGPNYFWVTPFNAMGYGVSSDPLYYNAPGKVQP